MALLLRLWSHHSSVILHAKSLVHLTLALLTFLKTQVREEVARMQYSNSSNRDKHCCCVEDEKERLISKDVCRDSGDGLCDAKGKVSLVSP